MRDIVLTLIIVSLLPLIFRRPHIGIMMWVWISVMNPHRLTYGFAFSFPWAMLIGGITLFSLVMTKQPKSLPMTPIVKTVIAFALWMCVTTAAAFLPEQSLEMLEKVMKILLMTLVTIMLVRTKDQLHMLLYVMCGSLAFYGVKGGLFTIRSGGGERVWGPPDSFIYGNNEVALAFVTIIPLMYYILRRQTNVWLRWGVLIAMLLCGLSALGSYSRGALIGIAAMVIVLWLRSPRKLKSGLVMAIAIPFAINFMPAKWTERMDTITTYKEDASAMGRVNAWVMAFNVAKDDPLTGGGYITWTPAIFAMYAPDPTDVHVAHSIYFQVMGEHGFVGLALYLLLAFLTWRRAAWIRRTCKQREDLAWAAELASMIQVSLIGFGVGGAFLSLAYFDIPYYVMAMVVILGRIVEETIAKDAPVVKRAGAPLTPLRNPVPNYH
ncbi:putative O-glycosylation ligase, exosortase A system-associated [Massilia soli]|uniref:O-glycosylation ligase, exosortase A system-associated n=1 Tax=Massilia soli TaxID=2792854 RepID=A0ABS7SJ97_9BURK|nr:putative O-glycosylation ligase, exosortase A system-associated [Massilia soli]MBZ2206097.1 putative O-glycosylation ligase, exosortase A system-associated [Massilia soli]